MENNHEFSDRPLDPVPLPQDPRFEQEVQRLHEYTVAARWVLVFVLWLTVGSFSLWALRDDIRLLSDHFTWASLRYALSLRYSPIPAIGLTFTVSMTVAVLVWQSRNILFGMPQSERSRLEQQLLRIRQQGSSHPLYSWIIQSPRLK
ncbi:MAG TPA: hypothetical protein V6D27_02355 [Vampirovibrionales bacterium]